MKSITGVIVGALIVILVIIGVVHYENNKNLNQSGNTSGGSLYVGVTDNTADISNVNDVNVSLKKVEIHSATKGWMTVSSEDKSYALLALHASGKTQLYGTKDNVPAGSYDKVRVTLGDAVVHTKTNGDVQASMPATQVVMNTTLKVSDGQTTNYKMDFLADKSLHKTSDNKYVFAPVINTESKSNTAVAVDGNGTMDVSGGTTDANESVGVDLDGSSRSNFVLSTDSSLKINSDFGGQLNFMLGGKSYTSDNTKIQEDENHMENPSMNDTKTNTDTMNKDSMTNTQQNGSTSGSMNVDINNVTH